MIGEIHFLLLIYGSGFTYAIKTILVKVGEDSGLLPQILYCLSPAARAAGPAALPCPGCSGQC